MKSTGTRALLRRAALVAVSGLAVAAVSGCTGGSDGGEVADEEVVATIATTLPEAVVDLPAADAAEAVRTYADFAFKAYGDAVAGVESLRASVASLVATPSEATLAAARQSWVSAREHYGVTEVLRGYGGPIDALERRVNGWPVDPGAVDRLVADREATPDLSPQVLAASAAPDSPVRTGFHAVEYLLWGADTSADGPGARPATDFDSNPDADRRRALVVSLVDLLASDLASVRAQWDPATGEFRTRFLADPRGAVQSALHGMASLSYRDVSEARVAGPLNADGPETEYARFSDNTVNDLVANAQGIRAAYLGGYAGVEGPPLADVVARFDPGRDADLRKQIENNLAALEALPGQFDQVAISSDDDADRGEYVAVADDFRTQGDAVVAVAAAIGLQVRLGG